MRKPIGLLTAALLAMIMLFPAAAFGASATVSISGATNVKAGEVMTVTVTYKGDSLGYVNGHLTYNTDRLEYLSGGSSRGNAGLVQLKEYADNAEGKLSFKVKFRAVSAGTAQLNLETLETQNLDGDADMGTPSAGMTANIVKAAEPQTTEAASEEESSSDEESDTSQETLQETESSSAADESSIQEKEGGSIPYPVLAAAAIVIIALIVIITIRLKRRK